MGIGNVVYGLNRELGRTKNQRVRSNYENQGRLIPQVVYQEMKQIVRCKVCGYKKGPRLQIDHIIPLSEGGTNERSNLQAICKACHRKKHSIPDKRKKEKIERSEKYKAQKEKLKKEYSDWKKGVLLSGPGTKTYLETK